MVKPTRFSVFPISLVFLLMSDVFSITLFLPRSWKNMRHSKQRPSFYVPTLHGTRMIFGYRNHDAADLKDAGVFRSFPSSVKPLLINANSEESRFWLHSGEIFNVKVYLGWVSQSCSLHILLHYYILLQSAMYCKYSLKLKGYTKVGCATPDTKNP